MSFIEHFTNVVTAIVLAWSHILRPFLFFFSDTLT